MPKHICRVCAGVYMHSATFGHNGAAMHIYSRHIHFTVLNACFNTRPGL